ncbi:MULTISPECIES: hypothetical protein [unclassified Sutcliffiella]|uniref:hypothetical protein n=1 Tax=unclassified Sutcliffiella TaxID=2837532 RepID=UPI0030D556B1
MLRHILISVCLISILGACLQQEAAKPSEITLEEVEAVLIEKGFILKKPAILTSENVFIQELNGITPRVYSLEGNTLSIYVFPSSTERSEGIQEFDEKTATMELIEHKAYGISNALMFYVSDEEKKQKDLFETLILLDTPE